MKTVFLSLVILSFSLAGCLNEPHLPEATPTVSVEPNAPPVGVTITPVSTVKPVPSTPVASDLPPLPPEDDDIATPEGEDAGDDDLPPLPG